MARTRTHPSFSCPTQRPDEEEEAEKEEEEDDNATQASTTVGGALSQPAAAAEGEKGAARSVDERVWLERLYHAAADTWAWVRAYAGFSLLAYAVWRSFRRYGPLRHTHASPLPCIAGGARRRPVAAHGPRPPLPRLPRAAPRLPAHLQAAGRGPRPRGGLCGHGGAAGGVPDAAWE